MTDVLRKFVHREVVPQLTVDITIVNTHQWLWQVLVFGPFAR